MILRWLKKLMSIGGDWKYTLIQYLPIIVAPIILITMPVAWYWWLIGYAMFAFLFNVPFAWWHHKVVSHGAPARRWMGHICRYINAAWGGVTDTVFVWQHSQHHGHSDTDKDPHHTHDGAWRRTLTYPHNCGPGNRRASATVMGRYKKSEKFLNSYYMPIWIAVAILWYSVDPVSAFFLHTLPAGLAKWGTAFLAGVVHRGGSPKDTWWLYPILFGECFHKQHHDNPGRLNSGPKWCDLVWMWGHTFGGSKEIHK